MAEQLYHTVKEELRTTFLSFYVAMTPGAFAVSLPSLGASSIATSVPAVPVPPLALQPLLTVRCRFRTGGQNIFSCRYVDLVALLSDTATAVAPIASSS